MKDYREKITLARKKINTLAKQYAPKLLDNNGNLIEYNAHYLAKVLILRHLIDDLGELLTLVIKEGKHIDEMLYVTLDTIIGDNE